MGPIDRAFADSVLERLGRLTPESKPRWGVMNTSQLYGHLHVVLRYTMGEGPKMPFRGNFISRTVFKPLIINQIVSIPRGVKLPRPEGVKERPPAPEATLDQVRDAFDAYFQAQEAKTLPARMHPFFGELSPAAWSKFHRAHFKHHLKQFGVWD